YCQVVLNVHCINVNLPLSVRSTFPQFGGTTATPCSSRCMWTDRVSSTSSNRLQMGCCPCSHQTRFLRRVGTPARIASTSRCIFPTILHPFHHRPRRHVRTTCPRTGA